MPKYEVYVKYEIEESFIIDAEDEEQAGSEAESREDLYPVSRSGGYSLPWDNIEAYEVREIEEEEA